MDYLENGLIESINTLQYFADRDRNKAINLTAEVIELENRNLALEFGIQEAIHYLYKIEGDQSPMYKRLLSIYKETYNGNTERSR